MPLKAWIAKTVWKLPGINKIKPNISFSYDSDNDFSNSSIKPQLKNIMPPIKNKKETKIVRHGIFTLKYLFIGADLCRALDQWESCSRRTGCGN